VEPVLNQYDIAVTPFTTAKKIVLEENRAVGIMVDRFGQELRYLAKKEVILSSGAFGSPHLLMLSGVGDKEELEKVGLKTEVHLPGVGKNLQDHVMTYMPFVTDRPGLTEGTPSVQFNPLHWLNFLLFGEGPLTFTLKAAIGLIHTNVNKDSPRPDIQIHSGTEGWTFFYGLNCGKDVTTFSCEAYDKLLAKFEDTHYSLEFRPTLQRPRSRGSMKLRSSNIQDKPIIDHNYLDDHHDLKTLVEACKYVYALKDTETFKKYNIKPAFVDDLHCGEHVALSDGYWECYVRHWIMTVYHHTSTCAMGPDDDSMAVVDHRLRVRGVEGLRVADASIMPRVVGANTHSAVTMIGEKAADLINEDWSNDASSNDKLSRQSPNKDEL